MFLTHLMVQLQSHSGLPQFQNLMWHLPWNLQLSKFLVLPAGSLHREEFTIPWLPALADFPHLKKKFCHCNRKKKNFPLKKKPEPQDHVAIKSHLWRILETCQLLFPPRAGLDRAAVINGEPGKAVRAHIWGCD